MSVVLLEIVALSVGSLGMPADVSGQNAVPDAKEVQARRQLTWRAKSGRILIDRLGDRRFKRERQA
jgi:hypothetical protein